ncbi:MULTISPECIES: hypothetical protein [Halorussus]|uniref:hypothetical protein n=1 Tax=Halorussus TaxID=1070314 RepID=UPI000E218DE9|nr:MULTISPECIES: hypothetical protein [Halorussus]NHN58893.1 hypothetical protein [Halorussus sp. JP-T4]
MSPRPLPAVAVAALVLLAGVGPVAGGATGSAVADRAAGTAADDAADGNETVRRGGDALLQYKVSLDNVTVKTWLLRNATVVNATVEEVVIRNATTPEGRRTNVTLPNVTVGQFFLERARLKNVTAGTLVVRNKSILSIPGGGFIDPNVENRTLDRHWTRNQTVTGVVIDRLDVDAATLCGNASLGGQASDPATYDPTTDDDKPDIVVENGTVGEALVMKGEATNWSVGDAPRSAASNASLPDSCNRG